MNNPIISAEEACRLNRYFQQKVDPRLFLFCNYEPTILRPISEEGAFYINVQDLYKFAIDSGCVVKQYKDYISDKKDPRFQNIGIIVGEIEIIRSVIDHNQSETNGKLDRDTLSGYSTWMVGVIGKSSPDSLQDFQKINQKLVSMAASLISSVEKFVNEVEIAPNKQDIVNKMISQILYWYSHNTKTRIYEGQLRDAYLSRANAAGKTYISNKSSTILGKKVGKWIEAALLFPYDRKEKELMRERKNIQDTLDRFEAPGTSFSTIILKMPEEKRKEILASLKQQLKKCDEEAERNKKEQNGIYTAINGKPYKYFFSKLGNQLEETMERLEKQGVPYTLLPQDLMQEDIEYRFGNVASPEYDF